VITIEHTHTGGTLVHGSSRDDGTGAVTKALCGGWRFSHTIGAAGAWYPPRSRDRHAARTLITAVAGFPALAVEVLA
jgi:hypothetical protein